MIFLLDLALFFLARHCHRVGLALARRNRLLFGDGAVASRFPSAFCRRPERHGKIIVVGIVARRRLQGVVVVDVRVFVVVFVSSLLLV